MFKVSSIFATAVLSVASFSAVADEVNIYTTREPGLIQPLLDEFSKDTGIKANTVFVKDGLTERVSSEGANSPADVLMTVDIGRLLDVVDAGLTQEIVSPELEEHVPAAFKDPNKHWYALSLRDRIVYVSKDLDLTEMTYEDLADPKYKGKLCSRSGQHPYNTSLIAAKIAHDGVEAAEEWLKGLKNNLARKAAGGDREGARDILAGICDVAIGNAYYVGRMKNAEPGTDQYQWGEAINVIRPTFENSKSKGTHANITGAAIAKNAPNPENALKLLDFLISEKGQSMYAKSNYEYPVRAGVELDPVVASFGDLVIDELHILEIAKHRQEASELVDKVGYDQ
ncbi:Iron deficiency-induced protein A precursor [Oligella ureolytica]|uniref:extracellular solute-binding protein n=1 Tax=Oligella ureolytica TaxID=90244 RepID=UPI000DFC5414|nr:extracellular solute-binding protein [Oligella ureolytica]SUA51086.1 Iron deficiency-induced protein A precursor [Oligella ureolytica]